MTVAINEKMPIIDGSKQNVLYICIHVKRSMQTK